MDIVYQRRNNPVDPSPHSYNEGTLCTLSNDEEYNTRVKIKRGSRERWTCRGGKTKDCYERGSK